MRHSAQVPPSFTIVVPIFSTYQEVRKSLPSYCPPIQLMNHRDPQHHLHPYTRRHVQTRTPTEVQTTTRATPPPEWTNTVLLRPYPSLPPTPPRISAAPSVPSGITRRHTSAGCIHPRLVSRWNWREYPRYTHRGRCYRRACMGLTGGLICSSWSGQNSGLRVSILSLRRSLSI